MPSNRLKPYLFIFFSALAAFSQPLILQNGLNGYSGCADASIVMSSPVNHGRIDKLTVEGYHCPTCIDIRSLIRFDLSSVPANSAIARATLSLYSIDQPRPGGSQIMVYPVTAQWEENEVSWVARNAGSQWSVPGGDFSATYVSRYNYSSEVNVWHDIDVTPYINSAIENPSANLGLILKMIPIMFTVRYASSNSIVQQNRPKLTIELLAQSVQAKPEAMHRAGVVFSVHGRNVQAVFPEGNARFFSLFSLAGQCVASSHESGTILSIDASALAAGHYVASSIWDGKAFFGKIRLLR